MTDISQKKEEFYKRIKIAGFISFIPLVLALGPTLGYFTGDFLSRKFIPWRHTVLVFTLGGLAWSLTELVRIIRIIIKLEKD